MLWTKTIAKSKRFEHWIWRKLDNWSRTDFSCQLVLKAVGATDAETELTVLWTYNERCKDFARRISQIANGGDICEFAWEWFVGGRLR